MIHYLNCGATLRRVNVFRKVSRSTPGARYSGRCYLERTTQRAAVRWRAGQMVGGLKESYGWQYPFGVPTFTRVVIDTRVV